ncbi:beta-propeller fold lactonase family protein [Variovorax sp. efr-133-TYG-130]|uniref:lactonase family protein n=1 Tax=Variovorax sp. efr-133-TYG-130 TaxID=3040327 RepID=UPI002553C2B4|nr:beta-propeller fold lactonase family protein [Variovorax sp. efr-133-TYG-130]
MQNVLAPRRNGTEFLYASIGCILIRYALNLDGSMQEQDTLRMPFKVQYACFDNKLGLAYVVCSDGGVGNPGRHHCLVIVTLDGSLRLKEGALALPHRPIHVSLDTAKHRLLIAYNLPAAVTAHILDENGCIREFLNSSAESGIGWFPHQILPVPCSDDVLLTCRGDDASGGRPENPGSLQVLRFSKGEIRLAHVSAPNDGYGFGPRNSAYHPSSAWLYTVLERQNAFAMFDIENGHIAATPKVVLSTLERPNDVRQPQLAGALKLHPNGRFAYVVNRSHAVAEFGEHMVCAGGENSIAVFSLDALTGTPTLVQTVDLPGLHARCIDITHGGKTLVAAIRQSSFRILNETIEARSAGFSIFRITECGFLFEVDFHAVDTGGEHLFWAGFSE